jgi:hypothetical protein
VDRRTDAADPLGESPGVSRVAALEDGLDASEHGRGGPGVSHHTAIDFRFDPQVALDAADRIDHDAGHD